MINKNEFSPYIRVAMFSTLVSPFVINERIIFDYEIILVNDGKCRITVEGEEYVCKTGDVVFLRPGVPHKFESVDGCDFYQPHIHFDLSYNEASSIRFVSFKSREAMNEAELSLVQKDVFSDINIPCVFTPCDKNRFGRIFFEIIGLFMKRGYNYELLCKARMLELLDCIITQFEGCGASAEGYNPVVAVRDYIESNYLSAITLDSLSKQFFINKFTLVRRFGAMYGQSVMAYYRSKRIDYIKEMLKTTDMSVTMLSERLNFTDIYSFSRFFKTHVGCSPSEYRRSHEDV